MPWHIDSDNAKCAGWAVVKDSDGKVVGCHATKAKALAQLAALNANVKEKLMVMQEKSVRPPRENLVRAVTPLRGEYEVREGGVEQAPPTLAGHFAVFDEWTEIDSMWEGNFMERIAPGAFKQSFRPENRNRVRVTFNHGHDPTMGDQVLGIPSVLEEDSQGAAYEVPLFDGIPPLLMAGLRDGAYGSSFRFRVMREEFQEEPEPSDDNPRGLPERTIKEVELYEFGPVTFPAYAGATAGVRSLTDEFLFGRLTEDPKKLSQIIDFTRSTHQEAAPSEPAQASATPEPERSDQPSAPEPKEENNVDTAELEKYRTKEEKATQIGVLKSELASIAEEHSGVLPPDVQERWNTADKDLEELTAALKAQEFRERRVAEVAGTKPGNGEPEAKPEPFQVRPITGDPYDRASVYRDAKSPEDAASKFRDNARRAIETTTFPHERANQEDVKGHIEKLLFTSESADAEIARRILVTGNPAYRRALGKAMKAGSWTAPMSNEERAIMAEGAGATGGFAITFDLDPTLVPTSNGAVNPYRRVCRVVPISGTNEWRAVSTGAVVATYEAEGTEAVDRSPTLAQPAFVTQRAQTLIDFSIELGQDWTQLQSEMATLIQDAKDTLEATQFATGVGTTVFPQGMVVGSTNEATTGTTLVLAVGDIYRTEEALPPRFRPKAQWFANRFIYNKVRQLDTAGGANLWVQDLRTGLPNNETGNTGYNLIGYPANEASGMVANLTANSKIAVLGDPNYYVIVERVGLDIELIPHLFGTVANYPTGRRGIYAMWRNTARVLSANAFVTVDAL
jgi:HK97 family phage major capsid protein/HK97 family phage prohead protease